MSEPFLRPRLTGARFEDHAIPLEFLTDLAALEEMIVEVAKWKYREAHPTRKRTPRGFTDGISLELTAVEGGSASAIIKLAVAGTLLFADGQPYVEAARDAIVGAIGAAERGDGVAKYLPDKCLGYFDRFGRSLRDGEAIEFSTAAQSTPVRLTKETRRKLVLSASNVNAITEDIVTHGTIPEADQEKMTFQLQLTGGRRLSAALAVQHADTILEAFNGYADGLRVRLKGVGSITRNGRLQGIESIEHINILEKLDVSARLDELRNLEQGWLEGKGAPLPPEGLAWLGSRFEKSYADDDRPLPYLYPTAESGIRAEWSFGPLEISLEIDIVKHVADWHMLNTGSGEESVHSLNLASDAEWQWLRDQIQQAKETV